MGAAEDQASKAGTQPASGEFGQARVAEVLTAVASDVPVPGGGGVCAAVTAFAAALAGMAGDAADSARKAAAILGLRLAGMETS